MRSLQSRRDFLSLAARSAVGLGLAQLPWWGNRARGQETAPAAAVLPLDELARALGRDNLLRPGATDFARVAAPWNLRYAGRVVPLAIARCQSVDDIRASLQWAQANRVPFAARSGGHSYAAYSQTPGLMIDVSPMRDVVYEASSGRALVGAGARNSSVYAALPKFGRTITHGRCFNVGVSGLVLGGGIGFGMRLHGLTADQLVETELMRADGQVVRCNARENADLFWACRGGGGGNFGINTSFTFQTVPAEDLTVFLLRWTENLEAILPAALDLLPGTPDRLGAKLIVKVQPGGKLTLELLGKLTGSPADTRRLLAPLRRLGRPSEETVRAMPYWKGQAILSEDGTPEYMHERSRYVFRPMGTAGSRLVLDRLRRWPGTSAQAIWKGFLLGGAVARVAPDATAYVHRAATMLSTVELNWHAQDDVGTVARNEAWLDEFHEALREFASDSSYQNFIDDAQRDHLHAYYGANLPRLVAVKRMVDPGNAFRYRQSIPV